MRRIIERRYISTRAGQIHLHQTVNNSLPPLILLHQTASSSQMYTKLMTHLHDQFWMIAPDMMGFGQSDRPDEAEPTIPFHTAVFWELLDRLEVASCVLFGHHTGASVALQMTHDQPNRVAGLGLSGPPLLTKTQINGLKKGLLPTVPDENGRFLLDNWHRLRQKEPRASLKLTLRETLLTLQAAESYPTAYHAVFNHPFATQLAQLSCPTLLMAGEQDSLYTSLEAAQAALPPHLPHKVVHIPNAGSYICDRQPAIVAQLIRNFFGDDATHKMEKDV